MSKAKIKITINDSNMNIKLENCSVISEVVSASMLVKNIAERLNTTLDEAFKLVKGALEAEEEKDLRKAFAAIARINELENKVNECSAES